MLYCAPVVGLILLVSIEIKLCIFILRQSNGARGTGVAQRENDRRKERGIWAGRSKKNCGPHLTAVLLTDGSQVCIVYRLSTRVVPCAAPRISFPPPLPHRRTCLLAREKFCRTQAHVPLGTRLRRMAGPKGK